MESRRRKEEEERRKQEEADKKLSVGVEIIIIMGIYYIQFSPRGTIRKG